MRLFWCCALIVVLTRATHAEPPPQDAEPTPDAPAISDEYLRLFERLNAEDFDVRAQAEERLHADGILALPALEQAAQAGKVGIQPAIFRLLERLWVEAGPDIADAAEQSLERLAFAENATVARRARAVLSGNDQLRMRRAVAAIRENGGRVAFMTLNSARGNAFFGPGSDLDFAIPGLPPVYIHVWLLRSWQGGVDTLWHLSRLEDTWSARLWRLDVTNVRGSGVPQEAVLALAARIPHLAVDERGASLGVKGGQDPNGNCQIVTVLPGGPAAIADLRPNDIVTHLDDIPISTFSDLVANLLDYDPGQEAVLKIERDGQPLDVPITLGGWQNLNVNDPPPPGNMLPLPAPNNR